jgi:hypothetical protein
MMTAPAKNPSESQAEEVERAIERCHAEITAIEVLLLAGHPDVEGLCMALADWSVELRLIEGDGCASERKGPASF